jgi:23S rRNA (uracil1939-C5)-methyltransferase
MKINFKIEHLDPIGQGVSKLSDKVAFIPKTLPGEEGIAQVTKSSKGVYFAQLIELTKVSEHRNTSVCPHYDECSGCQYLHTNYEQELTFKKNSLAHGLKKILPQGLEIQVHPAPNREHYRNRVQLHYYKGRELYLGQRSTITKKILPTPECRLPMEELAHELKGLYDSKSLPTKKRSGHVELYWKGDKVVKTFDRPYAEGGFSQVYEQMNLLMKESISSKLSSHKGFQGILDLFGGQGNISKQYDAPKTIVDYYQSEIPKAEQNEHFISLDLFDDESLAKCMQIVDTGSIDLMFVDPPRSGFKQLSEWAKAYKPEQIVYVSCKSATLVRDIANLTDDYELQSVELFDLFPSTQHFETVVFLSRRSS